MTTQITADSKPDYDMPFNPFDSAWTMADWIAWHKALKAKYGQVEAQRLFVEAWEGQSHWSAPYSWWKYNKDFVNYFNSQGFDAGHLLSKVVNNVSQGIETTSSLAKIALPLALVVAGAYVYNSFIKTKS